MGYLTFAERVCTMRHAAERRPLPQRWGARAYSIIQKQKRQQKMCMCTHPRPDETETVRKAYNAGFLNQFHFLPER